MPHARTTALTLLAVLSATTLTVAAAPPALAAGETVHVWLTTTDQANKLTQQPDLTFTSGGAGDATVVSVDDGTTFQPIDGIGASFTGSTVWELRNKLSPSARDALMNDLFNPSTGIGMSLLRQPIGGSDQNAPGTDCQPFSLSTDQNDGTIDLIHQAQQLNPALSVMSSVWCVPSWMLSGDALNPAYHQNFSDYVADYLQAYAAQGIPVWGITPQNEPLQSYANFGNNLSATQERDLIKNNLGPTFANRGLDTRILVFDHNWDHPEYVQTILNDPAAAQYVAGSAWHKYAGWVGVQSQIHDQYPDKGIYFTEASPSTGNRDWNSYLPNMGQYIDIMRNWSRTYLQWTIASNPSYGPGSCSNCGALVYIDDTTGAVTRSIDYYLVGHLSKFVRPGAVRVASDDFGDNNVKTVAFRNPDGGKALVAYNGGAGRTVGFNWAGQHVSYYLPAHAVATFTWSGSGTPSGGAL
ncbi:glycoside hydrolase family 30 protein, partial [Dactylosporangium siamense]